MIIQNLLGILFWCILRLLNLALLPLGGPYADSLDRVICSYGLVGNDFDDVENDDGEGIEIGA